MARLFTGTFSAVALAGFLALAACGGNDGDAPAPMETDAASEMVDDPTEENRHSTPTGGDAAGTDALAQDSAAIEGSMPMPSDGQSE